MAALTLQFATERSLGSALIRWFSHGPWSHVDLVADDGFLWGARFSGGVQRRPHDYASFSATRRMTLWASDQEAAAAWSFAREQLGKPYDMTAIFAFAIDRDWHEDESWFYSELAAVFLERASVFAHPLAAPKNRLTPCDLLLALSAIAAI